MHHTDNMQEFFPPQLQNQKLPWTVQEMYPGDISSHLFQFSDHIYKIAATLATMSWSRAVHWFYPPSLRSSFEASDSIKPSTNVAIRAIFIPKFILHFTHYDGS